MSLLPTDPATTRVAGHDPGNPPAAVARGAAHGRENPLDAALPQLLVIGAMKCGTTALNRYLDAHPEIAMAPVKELNFFVGGEHADAGAAGASAWNAGNWHRGPSWYARQVPDAPIRGEASPAYTSPAHPQAAERIARLLPQARLVYVVRDPIDRAISQYRHHVGEGDERRSLADALLDPSSQYLARSRYFARLRPFLAHFPRERVHVCLQEDLLLRRRRTLSALYAFAGADPAFWSDELERRWHVGRVRAVPLSAALEQRLTRLLAPDVAALRELTGRSLSAWRSY